MSRNEIIEKYIFSTAIAVIKLLPKMYSHITISGEPEFRYISERESCKMDFFLTMEDWDSELEFLPITHLVISEFDNRGLPPMNPPIKIELHLNIKNKNDTKQKKFLIKYNY